MWELHTDISFIQAEAGQLKNYGMICIQHGYRTQFSCKIMYVLK